MQHLSWIRTNIDQLNQGFSVKYYKFPKNVRITLELKMYLILKQKRAFRLNFCVLLRILNEIRTFFKENPEQE
jgi:hypothetical protein